MAVTEKCIEGQKKETNDDTTKGGQQMTRTTQPKGQSHKDRDEHYAALYRNRLFVAAI